MAKFDPPLLTTGPVSDRVFVITHGKVEPHPTKPGETMVEASCKYDVTEQFDALVAQRLSELPGPSQQAPADAPCEPKDDPSRLSPEEADALYRRCVDRPVDTGGPTYRAGLAKLEARALSQSGEASGG